MESTTTKRPSSSRTSFNEDSKPAPADIVLHLEPETISNLFNLAAPLISGTSKDTNLIEQLKDVSIRFPCTSDGRPLCEVNVLVDNIPSYVRQECIDECNRTIMRYMIAEAFLAPRD